jgi:hypothetical protein
MPCDHLQDGASSFVIGIGQKTFRSAQHALPASIPKIHDTSAINAALDPYVQIGHEVVPKPFSERSYKVKRRTSIRSSHIKNNWLLPPVSV